MAAFLHYLAMTLATADQAGGAAALVERQTPSPTEVASFGLYQSNFPIGARVFAVWRLDGWSYPAVVIDRDSDNYLVAFEDGDRSWVVSKNMAVDRIRPGSRVYCNWRNAGLYFPGIISRRVGNVIDVRYDDGDFETTTIRCLRI